MTYRKAYTRNFNFSVRNEPIFALLDSNQLLMIRAIPERSDYEKIINLVKFINLSVQILDRHV
jgi:hypothetical protein